MNSLGITLVWLAVQVTILALAGICLTMFAARRRPGGGAWAAFTALLASVLLAILAGCPLPSWWTLDTAPAAGPVAIAGENSSSQGSPAQDLQAQDRSSGGRVALAEIVSALRNLVRLSPGGVQNDGSWQWPATVAVVAVVGTGLGLLRLACGLLSIRRRRQYSRPVTDPGLRTLVEELRVTLGVKKEIALLEWAELSSPATVGWRKPVLLLPTDWRDWTEEQRRAVLAHELVHVARADFARGLLAQLSLALHFWHPLVHFLVRQYQVQLELGADAAAAHLTGGRSGYLRALAALALRSDGRAHGWPALALFSRKGTLLRRVEMLRTGREGNQTVSRIGRQLTLGGLIALALTLSLFRGFLGQTLAEAPRTAPSKDVAQAVPFDLSLLGLDEDKNAVGAYGFRPAAVFHRPSTEPWCREMNRIIHDGKEVFGKPLDLAKISIHVEDIEQVMGRVYVMGENKPGKRGMMFSVNVLRMAREMDWVKLGDQAGVKLKQHHWKGQTYVSLALPPGFLQFAGAFGKGDGYLWAPDARTLIFDIEDNIKRLIEAKISNRKPAAPSFAAGWDRFSQGLLVVALDQNRPWLQKISLLMEADIKEEKPGTPEYDLIQSELGFVKNVSEVVIGCAGDDDLQIGLWARTKTLKRAAALTRSCESALAAGKSIVAAERAKDPASKDIDAITLAFAQKLLTGAVVHHEGNVVTVHMSVASGFNALLSHYANDAKDAKGVDQEAEQKE